MIDDEEVIFCFFVHLINKLTSVFGSSRQPMVIIEFYLLTYQARGGPNLLERTDGPHFHRRLARIQREEIEEALESGGGKKGFFRSKPKKGTVRETLFV